MVKTKMGRPITTPDGDNLLALLRKKKGWNQEQTAEAIGVSRESISRIERGLQPLTGPVLKMVEILLEDK